MNRRREDPAQRPKRLLATALLSIGLSAALVTSACGADRTVEQAEGGRTSDEAVSGAMPAFAPEVAEDAAGDYAPQIDPSNFVNEVDNPYFPLKPGTTLVYEGRTEEGTERVEDTVLPETKRVMGVECVVLRDRVWLNGELIEDTVDWHAQDREGNVWYFGEDTKELENGKVVSTAGSWEAGVDGALPGIIMPADPKVGDSYRQEYYEGEAEDMAEVISRDGAALNDAVSTPYDSYSKDVLVTKDWSPLEPDILEHKYYAPGIGLIGELKVTGPSEKIELVDIKTGR
jgi:hypothetical protein